MTKSDIILRLGKITGDEEALLRDVEEHNKKIAKSLESETKALDDRLNVLNAEKQSLLRDMGTPEKFDLFKLIKIAMSYD